jgi:tetratricopeptide (TPR) repeat protein
MSRLLEILGKAITVDTSELIWYWLDAVGLGANDREQDQPTRLGKAIQLVGEMKHEAAAEQLRIHLFEKPACIHGRLAAAGICLHNGRLQRAIDELNSVYMRQPTNTMALYALGHCYERLGKESEAIEFYQDCLKFKKYLELPAQRLAAIYYKNGHLDRAIEQYEILHNEYPDDISRLITLGYLYMAAGKDEFAMATFNKAILMHPDNFHAEEDEADRLVAEGQLYEAIEQLEDYLRDQPDRTDLLLRRADILRMLGSMTDALAQYEAVVRMCPNLLEATIKLGTQYLQVDQDELAAEQFNRAVEINDEIVEAYIGLASSQKSAGSASEALGTLSLAAAIQPNSSLLLAETASLRFKAGLGENFASRGGKNDAAALSQAVIVAHCQQVAKRPQNSDLRYRLGVLMLNVGRIQDAIRSFEAALEINPIYTRARTKLAICLFESDRKREALDCLGRRESIDKDTLDLHYRTALLYCDRLKFASSLLNLEHHLEKNFAHSDATVNISVILQNLGLLDRAGATWDSLTEIANQAIEADYPFPS